MIKEFEKKNFTVLGLGEVMLRLSPTGKERISYSETFEKKAGGSELNVVAGISSLGLRTGIITKLPQNEIGKYIKHEIRFTGTSDDYIVYDTSENKRLGIYYYESGAYPRTHVVSYDRQNSSFTNFKEEDLPESIYSAANVFHTSGITLALNENLRKNVIKIINKFHENGALVSFDVNYRSSLWSEELAKETIEQILPIINILFISEETLRRMFKMSGSLKEIHKEFSKKYPNLQIIASTKRTVISPQKHNFTSLVYDCVEGVHYQDEPYLNIDVIDRIGSGDAYVAGALYGLCKYKNIEQAAKYGDAMAALKETIHGDMTECDLIDVERIIKSHSTTGQKDEMVR
ncbi:MAG: sugar kinase [Clostridia bacterium]|nr:sugar kinase [Clostridia bacterium]